MSTPSPFPDRIPQPVEHDPGAVVENLYPDHDRLNGDDPSYVIDRDGARRTTTYLHERLTPEGPRTRIGILSAARTILLPRRVAAGTREVTRYHRRKGEWYVRPLVAGAVVLGSLAVANAAGNAEALWQLIHPPHSIIRVIHRTEEVPGRTTTVHEDVQTSDTVGSTVISQTAHGEIGTFNRRVRGLERRGWLPLKLTFIGRTSPEWGTIASITDGNNADNRRLGTDRAMTVEGATEQALHGNPASEAPYVIEPRDYPLRPATEQRLEAEAVSDGYGNILDAITAVDSGEHVPRHLASEIKQYFTSKRGVEVIAKMELPGKMHKVLKTIKEHIPAHKRVGWGFYGFIPLPPIPKFRRDREQRERRRWAWQPYPIGRPKIIKETEETAWIRVRKEALQADRTLVRHPWAYDRKTEHLLKDGMHADRIQQVMRADWQTADGEQRDMRLMFVDHTPDEETAAAYGRFLESLAAAHEKTGVADKLTGIFIFPRSSAGVAHSDPRKIALGIDNQVPDEDVIGEFIGVMKQAELHVRTDLTGDELIADLARRNGPLWTIFHEAAGHGTDVDDELFVLQPVHVRGIANAHILDRDHMRHRMGPLFPFLAQLPVGQPRPGTVPPTFEVTYQVPDGQGRLVTETVSVPAGDPRLSHAQRNSVYIQGHHNTEYGGGSDLESYAETAASVAAGIPTEFSHGGGDVPRRLTDAGEVADFADGFRADRRAERLVAEALGAEPGTFPLRWVTPPQVTIHRMPPQFDSLLRDQMARARSQTTPTPDEMVAILARVSRHRSAKK
ncbi:MAG TPA: hypothetical protein VGS28_04965 [Candidatus Saccharimonadales bacterium]|nr:hypothetical protein [Candidatus Saccharimonadales bacterium]